MGDLSPYQVPPTYPDRIAALHARLGRREGQRVGRSEALEWIDNPVREDMNSSLRVRAISPVVAARPFDGSSSRLAGSVMGTTRRVRSPQLPSVASGHPREWGVEQGQMRPYCSTPHTEQRAPHHLSPRKSEAQVTARLSRALASSPERGRGPRPCHWSWRQEAGWQCAVEVRRAAMSEAMFHAARQRVCSPEKRPSGRVSMMANAT